MTSLKGVALRFAAWLRSPLGVAWTVFVAVALATIARGPGQFYYDADHYWSATQSVVGIVPSAPEGYWELRGVLTAFVFAPAALLYAAFGNAHGGAAVMLQNSLVLAFTAAFLLPRFVQAWTKVTPLLRWGGGALVWFALSGFAPYPVLDLYTAIAMVSLIAILRHRGWRWLMLAGLIAGVTLNLRPAQLIPMILVAIVVLAWNRWRGLLFPAGILLGLVPQLSLNLNKFGMWNLFPTGTESLAALQGGFASFTVRYDTVLGATNARQFYCSPDMAKLVGDNVPDSTGALVITFLETLPTSLVFSLEKISATLFWPFSTPYSLPHGWLNPLFAIVIVLVTVCGLAAILFHASRPALESGKRDWYQMAIIWVTLFGVIATIVGSATETRFALPLVLLGIFGTSVLLSSTRGWRWPRAKYWITGTAVVVALVFVFAHMGLSNPAPRGDVNSTICAEA